MPVLAILKALWGFRKFYPYVLILLLGLAVKYEHSRLLASRAETVAKATLLRTAEDANRDDVAAIAALQTSLRDLTKSLADANAAGQLAVQQASQASQQLQQRLAAAMLALHKGTPSDDAFLAIDLDASHPAIASSLRGADSAR